MKKQALVVCRSFFDQCPVEMQERLLTCLPLEEQEEFKKIPPLRKVRSRYFCEDLLEKIDLSWLVPYLRTLSTTEMHFVMALFPQKSQAFLAAKLKTIPSSFKLGKVAMEYARQRVVEVLVQGHEILPIAVLPESSFNVLLDPSQDRFSGLIRVLGLHDLAVELRQVIATNVLKKVFSALSPEEQSYLNGLMLRQEHLITKPLFFQGWDGTSGHLHLLLEERGACRLGQGMYQQHPSLLWYISRRFEMQKGSLFLVNAQASPTHPRVETIVLTQMREILGKFLREEAA